MAVVTENGPLYMAATRGSPVDDGRADVRYAGGRMHSSLERFTITVTDEATSTYSVGRLPREAVLLPGTALRVADAVTGTIDVGDAGDPDGLVDGYAGTADTTLSFGEAEWEADETDMGKPLWDLLGYSTREDAPSQIDIFITLVGSTQATDDAEGWVQFVYTVD